MKKISVTIGEEQMKEIRDGVRAEWEDDWNEEKLKEWLKTSESISIQDYLNQYGIVARYSELRDKSVRDLSDHERIICMLYWMRYGRIWE